MAVVDLFEVVEIDEQQGRAGLPLPLAT